MSAYMSPSQVPECCRNCQNLDSDSPDEYSPSVSYCLRNQIFPTKKLSCKARIPWTWGENEHEKIEVSP